MQTKQGDKDFTLILKHDKEMRVSRNEIAASSDFFSTLLNSEMRENKEGIVRLEHITEACMRDVLACSAGVFCVGETLMVFVILL